MCVCENFKKRMRARKEEKKNEENDKFDEAPLNRGGQTESRGARAHLQNPSGRTRRGRVFSLPQVSAACRGGLSPVDA